MLPLSASRATVENVRLPMDFCGTPVITERRDRAHELLRLMEIEEQADNLPAKLSGGQAVSRRYDLSSHHHTG